MSSRGFPSELELPRPLPVVSDAGRDSFGAEPELERAASTSGAPIAVHGHWEVTLTAREVRREAEERRIIMVEGGVMKVMI